MNSLNDAHLKKAVIFGAGKMACGLLGEVLFRSGFKTIFVGRRKDAINAINKKGGYTLYIVGSEIKRFSVGNCSAIAVQDELNVIEAVASSDIVFTAVGIDSIARISPLIAEGIWVRHKTLNDTPLNVIGNENLPGIRAYLHNQIVGAASPEKKEILEHISGFSGALTRRIMTGGIMEDGELVFSSDENYDLIIDSRGLKGKLPYMEGATVTDEFHEMVIRKLFTINCAQAMAAYLGYRKGCHFIHDAAVHPEVAPLIKKALTEAQAALKAEFPQHSASIESDVAEALGRIANVRLADTIYRVAKNPRRKLSSRERLVGAALLAERHKLPNNNLCTGIAAAIAYDEPDDPHALSMKYDIISHGIDKILTEDCGLLPYEPLAKRIKGEWNRFIDSRSFNRYGITVLNSDRLLKNP